MFHTAGFRTLVTTSFLRVDRLHVTGPDGAVAAREVVRHPGAVAVVPMIGDEIVLLRQYRAPIDQWILEIPAGKLDQEGERPGAAARRELEEEAGLTCERLEELAHFVTAPGFADEWITVYLARDCRPVPASPHGLEEETAEVVRIDLTTISAAIAHGEVEDAKTLIGLLSLLQRDAVAARAPH